MYFSTKLISSFSPSAIYSILKHLQTDKDKQW